MIEAHGLTDPGRKRKNNEDSVRLEPAMGLAIVADGMGGHQSGEVASSLAVETLGNFVARARLDRDLTWPFGLDPTRSFAANCLGTGIRLANRRILGEASKRPDLTGMGTTVVAVLAGDGRLTYAGVGDSRVYLARGDALRQLTRDDSWIEEALALRLIAEEERRDHPLRNVLTKAVGLQDDLEFDVGEEPLEDGDRVLLCSDGLTAVIPDERILEILLEHDRDLAAGCRALVD
ncbi:MAG: serine/threonine-protein phosphatase, partial [Candidatus Rokubacteria bacterium]|nr:serine/threonine-protein phosphatase [Candidatus Rokubacteria bacterium]